MSIINMNLKEPEIFAYVQYVNYQHEPENYIYTEPQKKRRTKNTILNSPYIYTMKLSTCVMIKFWCIGNLLLLNFL